MTDPRITNNGDGMGGCSGSGYGDGMGGCSGGGYGDGMGGYPGGGYGDSFGDNSPGMEERMLERRAQRMYQSLAEQGRFGQIDKAKHDKNYRNYLLQNFDEDGYGY